jgi:tetratricopeptide (TPR) repeat protein
MSKSFARKSLRVACVAAAVFGLASISLCQQGPAIPTISTGVPNQTMIGQSGGTMNDQLQYGTMGHQVAREQNDAYQAFLKERDAVKKIQKGRDFLRRYPKSPFEEQVDAALMDTYRTQADWKNEYDYGDKALALNPNDVDVLATVGWTIPHVFQPTDPDASEELDKAEKFAKHAIEVLTALPKPPDLDEQQFNAAKAKRTYQAHSALGLIYFRQNDYEDSTKELEESTKGNPAPDQTDMYVLGVDLMHLSRFGDATDAFRGCSQISGALQDPCAKNATAADAQAAKSKSQ